jgi:hypothetical protein
VTPVVDPPSSVSVAPFGTAAVADVAALRAVLASLRRQTRGWIWVESLAWVGLALAAFFWGTLAIDWCIEPPRQARACLLAAAAVGLAIIVSRKLIGRLGTNLGDPQLAVVVERAHPSFRDSLSTTIELLAGPTADASQSPDPTLLARTAAEAKAHLGQVRPERIFRRRRLVMLAFAAIAAVGSVAMLAVARPAVAGLWVRRLPLLADEPWPRRVGLAVEDFPGGVRKVARGSDVDVVVFAQAEQLPEVVDLRWRPAATGGTGLRAAGQPRRGWHTDRMGARGGAAADGQAFGHVLKAVNESLDLEIRGGDARLRPLRLEVLEPPALETLRITATPPAYLGNTPRELPAARVVQVPRGAAVEIACTATKPLSGATMVAVSVGAAAAATETVLATVPAADATGGSGPPSAPVRAIVGRIAALDADCSVVVRFTDTDGLVNREPVAFTLSAVPDEPPQVAVRLHGISTAVTPRARVPLVGAISDDHGIGEAAVRLKVADAAEAAVPLARVRTGDALVELPVEAAEVVELEPLGLGVGRTLELAVTATDTCTLAGGPQAGTSDAWSLAIVSPEALVAMLEAREIILRRRYESCVADLTQARDGFATRRQDGGRERQADAAGAADREAGDSPVAEAAALAAGLAAGLGEATSRAAGETGELAEAFRGIRLEFANNRLITPELETRLIAQIAEPLSALAARELPALAAACRAETNREDLLRQVDVVLARMRAVLDRMMELESFNEVLELLRGVIRTQEQIRGETLEQQKRRAREALERP